MGLPVHVTYPDHPDHLGGCTPWRGVCRPIIPLLPPHFSPKMTVVEAVKSAVGLADGTTASRQEMSDARLPLAYRDSCAHLLIPLNRCRQAEYYLPWKCENERHSYEKCQYEEFKKRVAKMDELRAAKGGNRSN